MSFSPARVSQPAAADFVTRVHRKLDGGPGDRYRIGCWHVERAELVGVAIVSVPAAPALMPWKEELLEITRCATLDARKHEPARNACTWLYARARDVAWAWGFRGIFTYTLAEEGGGRPCARWVGGLQSCARAAAKAGRIARDVRNQITSPACAGAGSSTSRHQSIWRRPPAPRQICSERPSQDQQIWYLFVRENRMDVLEPLIIALERRLSEADEFLKSAQKQRVGVDTAHGQWIGIGAALDLVRAEVPKVRARLELPLNERQRAHLETQITYWKQKAAESLACRRDTFAVAALQGLLADQSQNLHPTAAAELAYEHADAALAVRERKSVGDPK